MRILHTGDWHLNDRLGRVDRTEHLRRRVERVAEICEEESVDVLIVAGDLFAENAKPEEVADSFKHLGRTFAAFFRRCGTILAVTGNHDQDGRVRPSIDLARTGMQLYDAPRSPGERFETGRFYLIDSPFFGRLRDPAGLDVQFVTLMFPSVSRMPAVKSMATTAEEIHRPIARMVADWIRGLRDEEGFDKSLRTVFVAHMSVNGAECSDGRYRLSERTDVLVGESDLPTKWDYVALGHIHRPQAIGGSPHVRYCGSLDRLDFSERDDDKGVVLADVGPHGLTEPPRVISIPATSIAELRLADPNATAQDIRNLVPEFETTLVRVVVEPEASADIGGSLGRAIHEALPNVIGIDWRKAEGDHFATATRSKATIRETVLDYLNGVKLEHESLRPELVELAERYLDSERIP
jgi:exonuclease SbcD